MRSHIASLLAAGLLACGSGSDPNVPATRTLDVLPVASGHGAGTVTGAGGINCTFTGMVTSGTCSATYADGESLTLTAVATGEAEFATWGGDCTGSATCALTMSANRAVTARFVDAFTVTVHAAATATGSGTVTSNPVGIDCALNGSVATGSCSATFPDETAIILTAAPASGGSFLGWSEAGTCSTDPACVVPLNSSHTIIATF